MKKVVIGIVNKHHNSSDFRLETIIRDEVKQAIFDNNAIAIGIIPPNEGKILAKDNWSDQLKLKEKHDLYNQISLCDGIILQGGDFGDEYECLIAKYCYDYNIPILGICMGKHNLVRAVGGKIKKLDNNTHDKKDFYVHKIKIDKSSLAYQIIGEEEVLVNSRHMKCSLSTGNLQVVATSSDGVDEIVEDATKKFYMGVQFHPESLYKNDKYMNNIFKNFINICKQ